jgi:DNA-binding CsgD family transcriptional regulator
LVYTGPKAMKASVLLLFYIPGLMLDALALAGLRFSPLRGPLRTWLTALEACFIAYMAIDFLVTYSISNFMGVDPLSITTVVTLKSMSPFLYAWTIIGVIATYAIVYCLIMAFLALGGSRPSPQRRFMAGLPVFALCLWSVAADIFVPLLYDWTKEAASIHRAMRIAGNVSNVIAFSYISIALLADWLKRRVSATNEGTRRLGDALALGFTSYTAIDFTVMAALSPFFPFIAKNASTISTMTILAAQAFTGVSLLIFLRRPEFRMLSYPPAAGVAAGAVTGAGAAGGTDAAAQAASARFSGLGLTPREAQIAALILLGMSNKEICLRLDISHGTVKNHVFRLFRKLGVQSRFELTKFGSAS